MAYRVDGQNDNAIQLLKDAVNRLEGLWRPEHLRLRMAQDELVTALLADGQVQRAMEVETKLLLAGHPFYAAIDSDEAHLTMSSYSSTTSNSADLVAEWSFWKPEPLHSSSRIH